MRRHVHPPPPAFWTLTTQHSSELLKHRRAHIFTRPANPGPLVTREDSCGRRAEAPCSRTPWAQGHRCRVPAAGPHLALPGGSESPACTSRKFVAWPETERRQVKETARLSRHLLRPRPRPAVNTAFLACPFDLLTLELYHGKFISQSPVEIFAI